MIDERLKREIIDNLDFQAIRNDIIYPVQVTPSRPVTERQDLWPIIESVVRKKILENKDIIDHLCGKEVCAYQVFAIFYTYLDFPLIRLNEGDFSRDNHGQIQFNNAAAQAKYDYNRDYFARIKYLLSKKETLAEFKKALKLISKKQDQYNASASLKGDWRYILEFFDGNYCFNGFTTKLQDFINQIERDESQVLANIFEMGKRQQIFSIIHYVHGDDYNQAYETHFYNFYNNYFDGLLDLNDDIRIILDIFLKALEKKVLPNYKYNLDIDKISYSLGIYNLKYDNMLDAAKALSTLLAISSSSNAVVTQLCKDLLTCHQASDGHLFLPDSKIKKIFYTECTNFLVACDQYSDFGFMKFNFADKKSLESKLLQFFGVQVDLSNLPLIYLENENITYLDATHIIDYLYMMVIASQMSHRVYNENINMGFEINEKNGRITVEEDDSDSAICSNPLINEMHLGTNKIDNLDVYLRLLQPDVNVNSCINSFIKHIHAKYALNEFSVDERIVDLYTYFLLSQANDESHRLNFSHSVHVSSKEEFQQLACDIYQILYPASVVHGYEQVKSEYKKSAENSKMQDMLDFIITNNYNKTVQQELNKLVLDKDSINHISRTKSANLLVARRQFGQLLKIYTPLHCYKIIENIALEYQDFSKLLLQDIVEEFVYNFDANDEAYLNKYVILSSMLGQIEAKLGTDAVKIIHKKVIGSLDDINSKNFLLFMLKDKCIPKYLPGNCRLIFNKLLQKDLISLQELFTHIESDQGLVTLFIKAIKETDAENNIYNQIMFNRDNFFLICDMMQRYPELQQAILEKVACPKFSNLLEYLKKDPAKNKDLFFKFLDSDNLYLHDVSLKSIIESIELIGSDTVNDCLAQLLKFSLSEYDNIEEMKILAANIKNNHYKNIITAEVGKKNLSSNFFITNGKRKLPADSAQDEKRPKLGASKSKK